MTGFEAEDLMGELGIAPLLAKPFASADVERVVAQLLKGGQQFSGTAQGSAGLSPTARRDGVEQLPR